jgi:hypothetical protein
MLEIFKYSSTFSSNNLEYANMYSMLCNILAGKYSSETRRKRYKLYFLA